MLTRSPYAERWITCRWDALTATGGGVIRDMLVRELSAILYKGFCATAAIVGALVLLGLHALGLPEPVQLGAAAVACSALRFYALVKNVNLPKAQRLPEAPGEMTLGSGS